jgi:hypothetical protein
MLHVQIHLCHCVGHILQTSQQLMFSQDSSSLTPVEVSRRLTPRHLATKFKTNPPDIRQVANCDSDDSMHRSMCCVLLVAQVFALCPVMGITGPRAEELRFLFL